MQERWITRMTGTPDDAERMVAVPLNRGRGWRSASRTPALADVFRSVPVATSGSTLRRLGAFIGPGYLVASGYMDPGNWATSIAGGSKFGYALLFVALFSNLIAIVLQALAARLAIGSGRDLAQACRDGYPAWAAMPLWITAEIAIIATDLAEVIGTAIGLNLLFSIPLEIGIVVTALDVFVVLLLQRAGFRYLEAFVMALLFVIAACFAAQIALASPDWREVATGFVPSAELLRNPDLLYLALGIIGATVMPHNLYLHSAIVQTRAYGQSPHARHDALNLTMIDTGIALWFAFLINAAILILAAASFYKSGNTNVAELGQAHALLSPLLGSAIAPTLFGLALLCCGLNSTVTATLAGQAVMEGFIDFKLAPWQRRLVTRLLAIVPAAAVSLWAGSAATGKLLVLSQVILALQLPFAVIPLVQFTASRAKMGALVAPRWLTVLAALAVALVVSLNTKLVWDIVTGQT